MTAAPAKPAEPNVLDAVSSIIPKTVEISRNVIFGEIWERPGLSKRDRSLITVATLLALGSDEQHVRGHLTRALQNGATKDEIGELLTHLAFYVGWPAVMTAALIAKDVFEKKLSCYIQLRIPKTRGICWPRARMVRFSFDWPSLQLVK